MRILRLLAVLAPFLVPALLSPRGAAAEPAVVASIKPVHSLVAGIMEGVGEPRLLIGAGQSPHTYSLKPSEALALEGADLVLWIGPGLEASLERPVATLARPSASMRLLRTQGLLRLRVREGGAWELHGDAHEEDHTAGEAGGDRIGGIPERAIDPHIWLDPDNAVVLLDAIAKRLAAIDPENAGAYRDNAGRLKARIRETDAELRRMLEPVATVPWIVFHDAYQYFEHHYGLNAVGSVTLGPDRRPGARRLLEIRSRIAEAGARCVFHEPQFAPDLVRSVIEGTEAGAGQLDPLGVGQTSGPEAYPGLLSALARNLSDCLGAPG